MALRGLIPISRLGLGLTGRAYQPYRMGYMSERADILERTPQEIHIHDLYYIARRCSPARRSIDFTRDYIFKDGWEFEPAFGVKCPKCGWKSEPTEKSDHCDECGMQFLDAYGNHLPETQPDEGQKTDFEDFLRRVDRNGNSFKKLLRAFHGHLLITDDAFCVIVKWYDEWEENKDGVSEFKHWQVKELYVPDNRNFYMVGDRNTLIPGGKWWVCAKHRPTRLKDAAGRTFSQGKRYDRPGTCDDCGKKLYDVWYVATEPDSKDHIVEYYIGDVRMKDGTVAREVIHESLYGDGYGYGLSVMFSIADLCYTHIGIYRMMRAWYENQMMPRTAILAAVANRDEFMKAMRAAQDKNVSKEGTHIPVLAYTPSPNGPTEPVKRISLMDLPQEMQLMEQLEDLVKRIAAAFGIAGLFHNDQENSGLSNGTPGQQYVANLTAQINQSVYNDGFFPALQEQVGMTDWKQKLKKVEERDEMQEVNVRLMKAQEASLVCAPPLGFRVLSRDEDGNFKFSDKPADPMGAMGMMGGAGPPAPPPPDGVDSTTGGEGEQLGGF